MVVLPDETAVTRPDWSIVATPVLLELHATGLIRFVCVPAAVNPVAENWSNAPTERGAGLAGDTTTSATLVFAALCCVTLTVMVPMMIPWNPCALAEIRMPEQI